MDAVPDQTTAPGAETPEARRARLFRETARQRLTRWVLGAAYVAQPKRIAALPAVLGETLRGLVGAGRDLPDPEMARTAPDGLCGVAHDLSVPTLLAAYRRGLYPFSHVGAPKWWATSERSVLAPAQAHLGKNLRRALRKAEYTVTFDRAFEEVMAACAEPRSGRPSLTWITPRIMRAYAAMFDAGHAHSFEVWDKEGTLVGGGYGVALGRVFFTESQFSRVRDGSKYGFASLNHHLAAWGYVANDGKDHKGYLAEFGFAPIPRATFHALLAEHAGAGGKAGRWSAEIPLAETAAWANAVKAAEGSGAGSGSAAKHGDKKAVGAGDARRQKKPVASDAHG